MISVFRYRLFLFYFIVFFVFQIFLFCIYFYFFHYTHKIHHLDTLQSHNELTSAFIPFPSSGQPFIVEELLRINHSVHNEIISLYKSREKLVEANMIIQNQIERLRNVLIIQSRYYNRLHSTLISVQKKVAELQNSSSLIHEKWPIVNINETLSYSKELTADSNLEFSVNWNRCILSRYLLYCLERTTSFKSVEENLMYKFLNKSSHLVNSCDNQNHACLQISIGSEDTHTTCKSHSNPASEQKPTCLGLFLHSESFQHFLSSNLFNGIIFAAYSYIINQFRPGFDFVVPFAFEQFNSLVRNELKLETFSLLPGKRKFLLGFSLGKLDRNVQNENLNKYNNTIKSFDELIIDYLTKLKSNMLLNPVMNISMYHDRLASGSCWSHQMSSFFMDKLLTDYDWFPCEDSLKILTQSTFGLIIYNPQSVSSSFGLRVQLSVYFASGVIPIIFTHERLDLDEVFDKTLLSKAILQIPRPRYQELSILMQTISEADIIEMKRQGQIIFKRYLIDQSAQIRTLLLIISRRLGFTQPPVPEWKSRPPISYLMGHIRSDAFSPFDFYEISKRSLYQVDLDDFLGPTQPTQNSVRFMSNHTGSGGSARFSVSSNSDLAYPFYLFPSTPWDSVLPSDAAFVDSSQTRLGLRPINHSMNTAGFEFNMDLGGMHPYEQFTIVILTHDRFTSLCGTIEGFLDLPYLHSVLVIWNHPKEPEQNLRWPLIHVPIRVVHSVNNSLNNRFLPYDLIQTDCVLSLDDDIRLRHDEIIFAFRLWREHRDQLVGFPARFHAYDHNTSGWQYRTSYTCEFSMILTGAAFFHKYYSYAYTWEMPLAIRQMVDQYTNCEDIAMNFLIAHITRKPPIKATLHWSFDCLDCNSNSNLHDRSDHYLVRSKCINRLTSQYGYNPLIYTQFRADSVLFKTRVPVHIQKCFKFI